MSSSKKPRVWPFFACVVLAALPPLYLVFLILTATVDVPFADQWALVPLLDRSYRGTLTLGDLWAQHNEHRLLFPRLLMIGLARLSGWNTHVEMLGNAVLAAGVLVLLLWQARNDAKSNGQDWRWLLPIFSVLVFSLNQAENWWGGWNLQIFMQVLGVSATLLLLAQPNPRWPQLLGAGLCAIIATYSYSNGLLVWPIGLLVLIFRAWHRPLLLTAWGLLAALTIGSFFFHYTPTAQAPAINDVLANLGRYLSYTVTYLGAPLGRGSSEWLFSQLSGDLRAICNLGDSGLCSDANRNSMMIGSGGILLFIGLLLWGIWRGWFGALLPAASLGLYAVGAAGLTALGRASYGNYQAMAQRYATTATLFWAALVLMLAFFIRQANQHTQPRWRYRLQVFSAAALIGLIALGALLATFHGYQHFRWQYEFLAPAREELLILQHDDLITRLFPDPAFVRDQVTTLREHHLSVFR